MSQEQQPSKEGGFFKRVAKDLGVLAVAGIVAVAAFDVLLGGELIDG